MQARLRKVLTRTPYTPRSGPDRAEALCRDASPAQQLYAEAELALSAGEVQLARALLSELPRSYRRVQTYLDQCDLLQRLETQGVVVSDAELCDFLSGLFRGTSALVLARYAQSLHAHGITTSQLRDTLPLEEVDAVARLGGLCVGHRLQLERFVSDRTPWAERLWTDMRRASDRCHGLGSWWERLAPAIEALRGS